ncbi:hypothetical protein [Mycolicibacterium setense]
MTIGCGWLTAAAALSIAAATVCIAAAIRSSLLESEPLVETRVVGASTARWPADADPDVATDLMVGAVTYLALQLDPPDTEQMRQYRTEMYRQVGLLPR